jgi:hypothetical protein
MCLDCADEFDPDFSPDVERCLPCVERRTWHEDADDTAPAEQMVAA